LGFKREALAERQADAGGASFMRSLRALCDAGYLLNAKWELRNGSTVDDA
jgi:hypothetical protein